VFTLRCTARLLERSKVSPNAITRASTNRLGDWYANVIHVGRLQLVIAVSEKTFLPLVVPAAPIAGLVGRHRAALVDGLRALGIGAHHIDIEVAAMTEVAYGKTANRQVVGIMTDFARMLPYFMDDARDLLEVAMQLGRTPLSPLFKTTVSPDATTIALFNGEAPLRLVR
jgi:hypothetical protein